MLIVDGQIHLWGKGTSSPPHRQEPYSAEQAIAAMDQAGVDRALIHPVLWDHDSNELAVEAVRKYPNRFAIMGWFYLDDPNGRDLVAHWKERPGTLAQGNALLPAFIADYNARFAKAPANNKDLHRPLRAGDDLDDAFAWKEERTLSQALTLQYDKILFILEPTDQAKAAIGKRVTVVDYPDGRLAIRYRGIELPYRTFDKIRQVSQAAIVKNKQLGAALAFIREEQLRREPERRSGPRRRDQRDARLFKVG